MKVKCIYNGFSDDGLILNKVYEIQDEIGGFYTIIDETGNLNEFCQERFIEVKEDKEEIKKVGKNKDEEIRVRCVNNKGCLNINSIIDGITEGEIYSIVDEDDRNSDWITIINDYGKKMNCRRTRFKYVKNDNKKEEIKMKRVKVKSVVNYKDSLTKGKIYEVISSDYHDDCYYIIDDIGAEVYYQKTNFEEVVEEVKEKEEEVKMKKIKCINNDDVTPFLTIGKVYDVVDEKEIHYEIIDDGGSSHFLYKNRFIEVEEKSNDGLYFKDVINTIKDGETYWCGIDCVIKRVGKLVTICSGSNTISLDMESVRFDKLEAVSLSEAVEYLGKDRDNYIKSCENGKIVSNVCNYGIFTIEDFKSKWLLLKY